MIKMRFIICFLLKSFLEYAITSFEGPGFLPVGSGILNQRIWIRNQQLNCCNISNILPKIDSESFDHIDLENIKYIWNIIMWTNMFAKSFIKSRLILNFEKQGPWAGLGSIKRIYCSLTCLRSAMTMILIPVRVCVQCSLNVSDSSSRIPEEP